MISELKAYRIDDCDTWAGANADEALREAMEQTGNDRRDFYDADEIYEESRDTPVRCVDREPGDPEYTTVGVILDAMTKPGLVCFTEY